MYTMSDLGYCRSNDARDSVMSSASTVTYTSVYTDSEPGRVFWGADEELSDGGSPRVIVYGYDGLPMQPVAPPSPDYVPGPEHPPSPDYVPGPEHPPSPVERRITDYPADGGDGDDEPSDDDTDDEDKEPFEDEDDEEEEEHLAPVDSSDVPTVDHVPLAGDTEAFETDESAPTPRSPQIRIPLPTSRYEVDEVGESSTTVRPIGGYRADNGFIGTLDAETRRQRAEEDIYAVIEDAQDRQTRLLQRVDVLIEDREFHQETVLLMEQEALVSREAWVQLVGLSLAVHQELQAYRTHTHIQDYRIASQEALTATLVAHVSFLQGQLSAALRQIEALQDRDPTHADDPKGAESCA
ncbi:hypothetical protein Tco_1182482 [Tanacetum coccineum]